MKIFLSLLLVFFFAFTLRADCRGCCSRHDGVVCSDSVTMCGDGSPLSDKCRKKGCSKCTGEETSETKPPPKKAHHPTSTGYDRDSWPHWIDEDGDCQDTRDETLIRDNIGTLQFKTARHCDVVAGKWKCPYTGKVFTLASDMDIDHIVPLAHAYATGAATWTTEQKQNFANDPQNLLAVEDNTNQSKGDKGPAEWKPPLKNYWREYAQKWRAIKEKYGLTISNRETRALALIVAQ